MNMQGTAENLLTAFQFSIDIDNVGRQTFTSVDGLTSTVELVESWGADADAKTFQQKMPGQASYSDLTITANLTTESVLRDWRLKVIDGKYSEYRRNGSIVMYDGMLKEQARWNFTSAWPTSWTIAGLQAGSSSVLSETVVLAIEKLERA